MLSRWMAAAVSCSEAPVRTRLTPFLSSHCQFPESLSPAVVFHLCLPCSSRNFLRTATFTWFTTELHLASVFMLSSMSYRRFHLASGMGYSTARLSDMLLAVVYRFVDVTIQKHFTLLSITPSASNSCL